MIKKLTTVGKTQVEDIVKKIEDIVLDEAIALASRAMAHYEAALLIDPVDEKALLALHAGHGVEDLRHAEGGLPQGGRDDRRYAYAGPRDDDSLCARLDAALGRFAEHPCHGDDSVAARQHGARRRRRQRAARPRQCAGHYRHVPVFGSAARLSRCADGCGRDARGLSEGAHAETAAAEPDELPAEFSEVAHQPDEGLVRRCGKQGQ